MSITRWKMLGDPWMQKSAKGEFVLHAEHEREIARLTARCERLAEEVKAWRKAWCRGDIIMHPDGRKAIDSTIRTSLNHINAAQAAVDQHNDIGGAE